MHGEHLPAHFSAQLLHLKRVRVRQDPQSSDAYASSLSWRNHPLESVNKRGAYDESMQNFYSLVHDSINKVTYICAQFCPEECSCRSVSVSVSRSVSESDFEYRPAKRSRIAIATPIPIPTPRVVFARRRGSIRYRIYEHHSLAAVPRGRRTVNKRRSIDEVAWSGSELPRRFI